MHFPSKTRIGLLQALSLSAAHAQLQYGNNHRVVRLDNEQVSSAFEPIEDVELLSPAFLDPDSILPGFSNGTEAPTSFTTMDNFIRNLSNHNPWMTYLSAEFNSDENRPIPYLYLSSGEQSALNSSKLKVYIQADIHGDEPAAGQGALALLGKMDANQTWAASILDKMDIKMLPRYNVDGVSYFQRYMANGFDPNREHLKLFRQQSRDIKRTFSEYSPHISIDCHEYTAATAFGGRYLHGSDALLSGGINPNIHQDIRDLLLETFIPNMGDALEDYGLRWEPYITGPYNENPNDTIRIQEAVTEARTGRNAYGLTQTVSFLLEERGIGLADQHFQRRVASTLIELSSILETAAANATGIYNTIESARVDFINSTDDIVITDYFEDSNRTFTFVNNATGEIEQVPTIFEVTTPSIANLTRARPEAYILPSTYTDVAERLDILGLEVTVLEAGYTGPVSALNITSSTLEDEIYQGTVLNTVTTEPYETEVDLPAGSYWVSTRQKNAALAFIALEPENIDSYVTFNVIAVAVGDEYPVFRVPWQS